MEDLGKTVLQAKQADQCQYGLAYIQAFHKSGFYSCLQYTYNNVCLQDILPSICYICRSL